MTQEIRVGHSPDSDDAFMFYGLTGDHIDTGDYQFTEVVEDIESLNHRALRAELETSAISIHAYALVAERYMLLNSGASMGEGYGPVLISKKRITQDQIRGRQIAVPGALTSATLALRLAEPDFQPVEVPFDKVMDTIDEGTVDLGLIIHEGQLTYQQRGFHSVLNLGSWWKGRTGLPLPLGGNVIRRDLGETVIADVGRILKDSIAHALDNREPALQYALKYAGDLDPDRADTFVGMYVNERTLDYGDDGRQAVQLFLDTAHSQGLIPKRVTAEFVG